MTCNLEKTKVFPSSRSRWAAKAHLCNSLRLPEANLGSWPSMPNYSKKLKKRFRWIGPEVYGSADLDLSPVPGAGMTAFWVRKRAHPSIEACKFARWRG